MSEDNKNKPPRRGLPGGFLLIVLAAVLIFYSFQSMNKDKVGKVSFSHQVEHLVNLDLVHKDTAKKTALNDNLVTFSGKFKDRVSEDSKARYRFLELLNINNQLTLEQASLEKEVKGLRSGVESSADWFVNLSGIAIPSRGYVVVNSSYDMPGSENAVVVRSVGDRQVMSLKEIKSNFRVASSTPAQLDRYGNELKTLISSFRSPNLGIGNEAMKQQLKDMEESVFKARDFSMPDRTEVYSSTINQLQGMVDELNQVEDGVRLSQLRAVRTYKQDLTRYRQISEELITNSSQLDKARQQVAGVVWYFNNKELSSRQLEKQDPETYSQWFAGARSEWQEFAANQSTDFKAPDQPRTTALDKTFKSEEPSPNYFGYLLTLLPVLLVVFLLYFVFSKQMKGMGSGAMTFGKSPARLLSKDNNKVTFKDVAGCDEAKEELSEIVDFLRDPAKFTALGARIPKGVLCIGAPGTGKTLIAKAVAGEADRPFFSISGSDFVEMFVGVGASRIRDLFEQARKQAPCIIFIDEIDAVGRHRGGGVGGGHDEREQTLNQLLVEMDGFDTSEGVILIAATNRPDVLDKALLRPGRFDRRIVVELPDIKGRHEILKVHARKIKLDSAVDLMTIARNTPGASGADLANILNESALLAARNGRSAVTQPEVNEACDKVRYGKERRSLEIDNKEKRTTAIHESGHAIVGLVVEHGDTVDKVTIIPRGLSLGATHFMPKKNRLSYWKKEVIDQLAVLMGGRVAEEIFIGDISSGAQMDISQATRLVRSMVCEWGMTDALGAVAYDERSEQGQYLGMSQHEKNYSEETAKQIDDEVRSILDAAHKEATKIIEDNRDKVQLMTDMLMEFETLDRQDVDDIINGTFDENKKKERVKSDADRARKDPPPPPNPIENTPPNGNVDFQDPSPQGT
ncbi:MAG: ATP-dependent zinc metalloprotease FtsH [Simkaniaceae bacterium]|nr:ATP-dependent zinc metalloprotease FtsH [Candidatus Sacchlamyda saccharinae]